MDIKTAKNIIGSDLYSASKMPCLNFGLPAKACKVGSKLRDVVDSVCYKCYAFRGNYTYSVIQKAQYRRLANLYHPQWIDAFVTLLKSKIRKRTFKGKKLTTKYFRFHDSGDLQSVQHLENIAEVARQTKSIKYWLPTREYQIVQDWFAQGYNKPNNLVIRLSAHIVNGPHPTGLANRLGVSTSGVHRKGFKLPEGVNECRAYTRKNMCGMCRMCWDPNKAVSYKLH